MELYFKSLNAFIADVIAYEKEINVSTPDENGQPKIQLIGIDGKPTDEKGIFDSRQSIFESFRMIYDAYSNSGKNPSIEDFHNANLQGYAQHSVKFRLLVDAFYANYAQTQRATKMLDEIKKSIEQNTLSEEKIIEAENKAKGIINGMFMLTSAMKHNYDSACPVATLARIQYLAICYTQQGRKFLEDKESMKDEFTPRMDKMFGYYEAFIKTFEFNAKCDSVRQMITSVS